MEPLRALWRAWRRFGQALGDILARVVLTAFYFTVMVPFVAIARATQDPLGRRAAPGAFWQARGEAPADLAAARRQ